jgi:riboflavin synthase
MFTGLIRDLGEVIGIDAAGGDVKMTLMPRAKHFEVAIGDSIACNGVCLTATAVWPDRSFTVELSAETMRVTNAGTWRSGSIVNLEPSVRAGDALGGHYVSGHVDAVGRVMSAKKSGASTVWEFEMPLKLIRYVAPKGSITINGVSLTVNTVTGNRFTVNIIAHTAKETTFYSMKTGDLVNIEIDMIARYVARLMEIPA